jgi:uncharacterized protein YfaT (DUF1175 family)
MCRVVVAVGLKGRRPHLRGQVGQLEWADDDDCDGVRGWWVHLAREGFRNGRIPW